MTVQWEQSTIPPLWLGVPKVKIFGVLHGNRSCDCLLANDICCAKPHLWIQQECLECFCLYGRAVLLRGFAIHCGESPKSSIHWRRTCPNTSCCFYSLYGLVGFDILRYDPYSWIGLQRLNRHSTHSRAQVIQVTRWTMDHVATKDRMNANGFHLKAYSAV